MTNSAVDIKKVPAGQDKVPDFWRSFRREMDRLFDRFDGSFSFPTMRGMFDIESATLGNAFGINVPAVDVTEEDKAYKITAELPGLDEKNVEVSVSGDSLVIKGEKRQEKEEKGKNNYLSERAYGMFQRSFLLPEGVDRDKIAATCVKGVLTISLPKTADAQNQQKKIEVKAA